MATAGFISLALAIISNTGVNRQLTWWLDQTLLHMMASYVVCFIRLEVVPAMYLR